MAERVVHLQSKVRFPQDVFSHRSKKVRCIMRDRRWNNVHGRGTRTTVACDTHRRATGLRHTKVPADVTCKACRRTSEFHTITDDVVVHVVAQTLFPEPAKPLYSYRGRPRLCGATDGTTSPRLYELTCPVCVDIVLDCMVAQRARCRDDHAMEVAASEPMRLLLRARAQAFIDGLPYARTGTLGERARVLGGLMDEFKYIAELALKQKAEDTAHG
jgi:hypothetical protein